MKLNSICIKPVETQYDYEEMYLVIDGKPIVRYLDEYVKAGKCPSLKKFGSLLGLYPAWGKDLICKADSDMIWMLIDSNETVNIPILVCEDDLDLECIVIIAKIRKDDNFVYLEKLGLLNQENRNFSNELCSGILDLESYTEEDWAKYGDNIALSKVDSTEWKEWISKNLDEELFRRRKNYTNPYIQNYDNIIWIESVNWIFNKKEYQGCVEIYRRLL